MKGKGWIEYDDDLVAVYNEKGEKVYSGLEDYEPMKNEHWLWDKSINGYRFENYIKILVG